MITLDAFRRLLQNRLPAAARYQNEFDKDTVGRVFGEERSKKIDISYKLGTIIEADLN